ncbi:NAD(P)/FAD-dependent oxidoreductase [Brevibacterium aurantiacum]|uniref:NAD(P)/FAD-dependent oxidoreductase n=1 Tax=Brevibacterium aurantiacum TaxID=273384 RepID=UPI0021B35E10|nr:FAD-dependent oxidoreductase [Brevibacterium aurantiacum]
MDRNYENIVIVGYGIAGMTAADTLRSHGYQGRLAIVGGEPHEPYSRPALSKAVLADVGTIEPQYLPASDHGARVFLGNRAVALDLKRSSITLDNGEHIDFDGLVIASGSSAKRFTDHPREFSVRSHDDALRLRTRLHDQPSVVILGGGPLGMEIASAARKIGCAVTLVHRGPPMASHLGPYLGSRCSEAARAQGVELIDGRVAEVCAPDSADGPITVCLESGQEVGGDVIVSTIGDAPEGDWLADSGLLTDGRLKVDTRGRVNEHIVAAGDIAWLPTADGHERQPLWTAAIEQAKTASLALLVGDEAPPLDFQSYFWTEQFGLTIRVSGDFPVHGEPEVVARGQKANPDALLLRWSGDAQSAAAAVGYRIAIPKLRKVATGDFLPS